MIDLSIERLEETPARGGGRAGAPGGIRAWVVADA